MAESENPVINGYGCCLAAMRCHRHQAPFAMPHVPFLSKLFKQAFADCAATFYFHVLHSPGVAASHLLPATTACFVTHHQANRRAGAFQEAFCGCRTGQCSSGAKESYFETG
jgi:hypothetical protein